MGSSASGEYCAFTKAVEHLGDRWSLLIVRELALFGPQGFNALAAGLPGRVSRSVLASKLRSLERLGLVVRDGPDRPAPYRLAPAGEQLVPTLKSLWAWAERWVPEDRSLAERDPTVIAFWLSRRVLPDSIPERQTVLEIRLRDARRDRVWLLLERDAGAELCAEDPLIDAARYVYLEASGEALLPVARGERAWADAIADGSVELFGEPRLVASVPAWFAAPLRRVTGGAA